MHVHHLTDRAVRVSDDGEDEHAVWLPLSAVEVTVGSLKKTGSTVVIEVPEWLAEERRLV